MWVKMEPSAQSSFQKLNVDNSCQKTRKIRYYIFEVLSNFTIFLYFVPNILDRIVRGNKFFASNLARSPSHLNLWIFSLSSKDFSFHDVNMKQVDCVKSSKFNSFVLALFCILGLGQNLTLETFRLCRLVIFWRKQRVWVKIGTFSRKLNHHCKKRE